MKPDAFRAIMLQGSEKLAGTVTGTDRAALIRSATWTAATYYAVPRDHIHVTLFNATVEWQSVATLQNPDEIRISGFGADFIAEVSEP